MGCQSTLTQVTFICNKSSHGRFALRRPATSSYGRRSGWGGAPAPAARANPGADMHEALGPVLAADTARQHLSRKSAWKGDGTATYLLWDRAENRPIYCGTARTPRRLLSHLDKDDLANRPVGKTTVNPELRAYCLSRPKGWLGVSFSVFPDENTAKKLERSIISHYGIRRFGGTLYNQRLSG